MNPKAEIEEIVSRETGAWDTHNVELLLTCFHPDMVWPWPPDAQAHDPMKWEMGMGRFDYDRWKTSWQELFNTHTLAYNKRDIKKIVVSDQGDGAFAVVDIDTLWVGEDGNRSHWKGRVCKVYAKVGNQWKMTMHIGVLDY